MKSDQVGTCTVKVSTVNDFSGSYAPINDVNPALFSGSDSCSRVGNPAISGGYALVIGKRAAEFASDGAQYSRALQVVTPYYVQVTIGSDTATTQFTTGNIPLGSGWNDPLPSDKSNPGVYAWPSWSATDRTQGVVDPQTGVLLKHLTTAGDFACYNGDISCFTTPQTNNFSVINGPSPWVNPGNVQINDTNSATISGSQTPLELNPNLTSLFATCPGQSCDQSHSTAVANILSIQLSVNAWCSDSGDNCPAVAANDRTLEFALTVDGVNPAGNWVDQTVAGCASSCFGAPNIYTVGTTTPILASWFTHDPTFDITDVNPRVGTVNCNGTTAVAWASGTGFDSKWGSGSAITIGGTAYTIASVASGGSMTLTTSCPSATGAAYSANNFGVLVRKKTTSADTLFVQYVGLIYQTGTFPSWDPSGDEITNFNCSSAPVAGPGGEMGYHCAVSTNGLLVWIGDTTGTVTRIGPQRVPTVSGSDGWDATGPNGMFWDGNDGNSLYFLVTGHAGHGILVKASYIGTNADTGPYFPGVTTMTACAPTPVPPCWQFTNLTPGNQYVAAAFDAFSPAYNAWHNTDNLSGGWKITNTVGSLITMQGPITGAATNNSMCFWAVYSPTSGPTGSPIAALPSWSTWPNRWTTCHGPQNIDSQDYYSPANEGFVGGWSGTGSNGQGPYTALITSGAISATGTACPTVTDYRVPNPPTGNNCLQVTLNGSVCDPSPGPNEPADGGVHCGNAAAYYRQDLAPGDIVCIANIPTNRTTDVNLNGCGEPYESTPGDNVCTTVGSQPYCVEFFRVLVVSGNNITLQRGWLGPLPPSPFLVKNAAASVVTIPATCDFGSVANICNGGGQYWHFSADPLGLLGDTIISSTWNGSGHGFLTPTSQVASINDGSSPTTLFGLSNGAYMIRGGGSFTSVINAAPQRGSNNPPFNGRVGWGQPNETDSHPSPLSNSFFGDMRPFLGNNSAMTSGATLLSGSLYQWHSGAFANGGINRKYFPTMALVGHSPLLDISSAATGNTITGNPSDAYKYCVALNANECQTGSLQGDVFVNAPFQGYATTGTPCPYMGVGNLQADLMGVCVFDNGTRTQGMTQTSWATPDLVGDQSRVLSHVLSRYYWTYQFWNWKEVPGGHWGAVMVPWLQGQRSDIMLVRLPPPPAQDSVSRGSYIPIKLSVGSGVTGDTVKIQFGYAENEPAGSAGIHYYCTSRQEPCDTTTDYPGTPFVWDSEPQKPAPCDSGCTVTVPAKSGRVLYWQIVKQNGASITTTPQTPIVVR